MSSKVNTTLLKYTGWFFIFVTFVTLSSRYPVPCFVKEMHIYRVIEVLVIFLMHPSLQHMMEELP